MMIENLEDIETQARAWCTGRHPDASLQHHAAFVNSVTYAITRFTGRFGGPSVREHAANAALNESEVTDWSQCPREGLYVFLEPMIYGPISDSHIRTWIAMKDICFDDDPADVEALKDSAIKGETRYEHMRIYAQTVRKIRIAAAMCNESLVEAMERLANKELARLRYGAAEKRYRTFDEVKEEHFRNHPDEIDGYITAIFEEYAEDKDIATLLASLRVISHIKGVAL